MLTRHTERKVLTNLYKPSTVPTNQPIRIKKLELLWKQMYRLYQVHHTSNDMKAINTDDMKKMYTPTQPSKAHTRNKMTPMRTVAENKQGRPQQNMLSYAEW